jgi:uncharacterized repeat protein (TIGR04052 family)
MERLACVACSIVVGAACGGGGGSGEPVDAPSGEDAPAVDAAVDAPTVQRVTIPFAARVSGAAFACGQSYQNIGSTAATYVGIDFRFYVHDVRVSTAAGDVPVKLDVNSFQTADGLALLDFETGGVGCQMGTVATHPAITGTVPIGTTYTGVKLRIGVPFAKNHLDATLSVAPMNVPAMYWAWSSGYKFIKVDGTVGGQGFSLHLGSTGCGTTGTTPPSSSCTNPNVIDVALTGIVPGTSVIIADVGPVLAEVDIATNTMGTAPGCMADPGDPECNTVMPKLGLPFGAVPAGAQQLLKVE